MGAKMRILSSREKARLIDRLGINPKYVDDIDLAIEEAIKLELKK